MEDDRPVLAPGGGLLDLVHAGLLEQAGAAHADLVPIDLGLHAQGGGGADVGSGRRLHAVGLRPRSEERRVGKEWGTGGGGGAEKKKGVVRQEWRRRSATQ